MLFPSLPCLFFHFSFKIFQPDPFRFFNFFLRNFLILLCKSMSGQKNGLCRFGFIPKGQKPVLIAQVLARELPSVLLRDPKFHSWAFWKVSDRLFCQVDIIKHLSCKLTRSRFAIKSLASSKNLASKYFTKMIYSKVNLKIIPLYWGNLLNRADA